MKLFRDFRRMCYVIEIDPDHFEFLLAREISDALVPLIKKDRADYGVK